MVDTENGSCDAEVNTCIVNNAGEKHLRITNSFHVL